jgi:hypothetical protein
VLTSASGRSTLRNSRDWQDLLEWDELTLFLFHDVCRHSDNTVDMNTGFDCFSELSHTDNVDIETPQAHNRQLLVQLMDKHGFQNYPLECRIRAIRVRVRLRVRVRVRVKVRVRPRVGLGLARDSSVSCHCLVLVVLLALG